MAICYANNDIINAEENVGVLRGIAYAGRCAMTCPINGKTYDWSRYKSDVLFRDVLLPDTAPEHFKNPPRRGRAARRQDREEKIQRMSRTLWRAVDQSERVFDRKDKVWRFRKRGQLAYRLVLALPAGRPVAEISQLAADFVRETFVDKGVPAEIAIHKAEDEASLNVHAHVIAGTRRLGPDGFDLKARDLLPDFVGYKGKGSDKGWSRIRTGHEWPRRWAAYQNAWYQRRGIDLQVDPIAAEPGIHIGKWRDPEVEAERRAADEAKRIESAAIARDPERLLRVIEDQMPVFGLRDVLRHLRRNGVMGHEAIQIAQRVLELPEIVAVEPRLERQPKETSPQPAETRRYTTRSILEQEDRIHENVEYLYGEMVWGKPLPAGMKACAERLIAERTLDPEQAGSVLHTIEGPGIRAIQGSAGTGKSHLLSTTRMVFEAFNFKVIAMAPTNMVAADLRKNGFDACTIHRFIYDVKKGKRKLHPNSVLVVDEGGMVNTNLYDELIAIARQHKCRLILAGDDRQLPPIGRGGIFGKIRHMVGDAHLSKVRRQNVDWMKTASESLSRWDIKAGVEAYQLDGAIKWSRAPEQAMYALVEQCGRDLDADPTRDLSGFFAYCALNQSADILNNEIQERIWRSLPAKDSYEIKCCHGQVRIRRGDRIQFHETDLKRGLFNGAIGTISNLDSKGIHVRLDSGEDVVFDPREFKGWGLGYAGTVHRGQGQTKHRSYVLYDSAYAWNAPLAYVALTRHKDSTSLFVPRTLAADQHALIEQISRAVSQPLASDYTVIDRDRALEDARIAINPPATWHITGSDDRERELNLFGKRDMGEAESAFRRMPPQEFATAYSKLRSMEFGKPADHPYQALRRSVETIASVRGFLPSSGAEDPNFLMGVFREDEREHHLDHVVLDREPGEMDVSTMVIDATHVDVALWQTLIERLRQVDQFVRDAAHVRLGDLRARVRPDSAINAALGVAQFVLRLCNLAKPDAVPSNTEIGAAIGFEATPRPVFEPLKLWRKIGPDDYEKVPFITGIRRAFGERAMSQSLAGAAPHHAAPAEAAPAAKALPPSPASPVRPRPSNGGLVL